MFTPLRSVGVLAVFHSFFKIPYSEICLGSHQTSSNDSFSNSSQMSRNLTNFPQVITQLVSFFFLASETKKLCFCILPPFWCLPAPLQASSSSGEVDLQLCGARPTEVNVPTWRFTSTAPRQGDGEMERRVAADVFFFVFFYHRWWAWQLGVERLARRGKTTLKKKSLCLFDPEHQTHATQPELVSYRGRRGNRQLRWKFTQVKDLWVKQVPTNTSEWWRDRSSDSEVNASLQMFGGKKKQKQNKITHGFVYGQGPSRWQRNRNGRHPLPKMIPNRREIIVYSLRS